MSFHDSVASAIAVLFLLGVGAFAAASHSHCLCPHTLTRSYEIEGEWDRCREYVSQGSHAQPERWVQECGSIVKEAVSPGARGLTLLCPVGGQELRLGLMPPAPSNAETYEPV